MKYRSIEDLLLFEKFILFGAGPSSDIVYDFLRSVNKKVIYYSDNNDQLIGNSKNGTEIIHPDYVKKNIDKKTAVIISSSYQKEVANQLLTDLDIDIDIIFPYINSMFSKHFTGKFNANEKKNLDILCELLCDSESIDYMQNLSNFRQTMDPTYLIPNNRIEGFYKHSEIKTQPSSFDILIDVGAYIGDTIEYFVGEYFLNRTIIAIEADSINYYKLKTVSKKISDKAHVIALHIAASDKKGKLSLQRDMENIEDPRAFLLENSNSFLSETVNCDTLDNITQKYTNGNADYIKIDIEGAEIEAIRGSINTIRRCTPAMAIACYHVKNHLWEIPFLINEISSGQALYMGHHYKCIYEPELFVERG